MSESRKGESEVSTVDGKEGERTYRRGDVGSTDEDFPSEVVAYKSSRTDENHDGGFFPLFDRRERRIWRSASEKGYDMKREKRRDERREVDRFAFRAASGTQGY